MPSDTRSYQQEREQSTVELRELRHRVKEVFPHIASVPDDQITVEVIVSGSLMTVFKQHDTVITDVHGFRLDDFPLLLHHVKTCGAGELSRLVRGQVQPVNITQYDTTGFPQDWLDALIDQAHLSYPCEQGDDSG